MQIDILFDAHADSLWVLPIEENGKLDQLVLINGKQATGNEAEGVYGHSTSADFKLENLLNERVNMIGNGAGTCKAANNS